MPTTSNDGAIMTILSEGDVTAAKHMGILYAGGGDDNTAMSGVAWQR